jgi:DNA-binding transcriptional LysR family regulator
VTDDPPALRIAFVPGVTLRKWTGAWQERNPAKPLEIIPSSGTDAIRSLREGDADLAFVRLPIDRDALSVVRIYGEAPVVVVSRDSELSTRTGLSFAEVDAIPGIVQFPFDGNVKDAVELVAAGVGAVRLPHSLARLFARKDVAAIPVEDAEETDIAVVWVAESLTPDIEEFVGIVRGRTAASSRSATPPVQQQKAKKAANPAAQRKPHRVTGNRAQARNRKGRGGR